MYQERIHCFREKTLNCMPLRSLKNVRIYKILNHFSNSVMDCASFSAISFRRSFVMTINPKFMISIRWSVTNFRVLTKLHQPNFRNDSYFQFKPAAFQCNYAMIIILPQILTRNAKRKIIKICHQGIKHTKAKTEKQNLCFLKSKLFSIFQYQNQPMTSSIGG